MKPTNIYTSPEFINHAARAKRERDRRRNHKKKTPVVPNTSMNGDNEDGVVSRYDELEDKQIVLTHVLKKEHEY